jgi:predicted amidophosphoribosyltransferase
VCTRCRRALLDYEKHDASEISIPRITAFRYEGEVARALVGRFKYKGAIRLADFLAEAIARRWDWSKTADGRIVLVPVPLSPGRYRERGYNQARLLAESLAVTLQLPMAELVRRVRPTRSQTRLS